MTSEDAGRELFGMDVSEAEARTYLGDAEFGVLGLTKEGEAYTVPLSFGYDTDLTTLYFLFAFEGESKKREFVETTETASFTVVESELPDAWTSVILTGTLTHLSDEESTAYAALADTATFPALYTFEDYVDMESVEQSFYQFEVETITARRSPKQLNNTASEAIEAESTR